MPPVARGIASPWFTGRAHKPDDGESEPNDWLGHASGPRTDQQQTCKDGTEKEEKWKICELQICCPRNQNLDRQADRDSTDMQKLGHS
jgi:hypothetical protein